jgi:hypothetical protein
MFTNRDAGIWEQIDGSREETQEHGNRCRDHGKRYRNMGTSKGITEEIQEYGNSCRDNRYRYKNLESGTQYVFATTLDGPWN